MAKASRKATPNAKTDVAREVDCLDADIMVALRDEFGISFGKVPKLVTAGDVYDVLVAKLKAKLPTDAWPRLQKMLATTGCKTPVASKQTKLR